MRLCLFLEQSFAGVPEFPLAGCLTMPPASVIAGPSGPPPFSPRLSFLPVRLSLSHSVPLSLSSLHQEKELAMDAKLRP